MAALFSFVRNCIHTWTLVFVHVCLASFVVGRPHTGAVVFICGCVFVHAWSFPYMRGCFQTDVGEWGHGRGCVVVVEDRDGGGGGGGGGGVVVVDAC